MAGSCSTVVVMQKNGGLTSRTMSDSDILMELIGTYEESFDRDYHQNDNKISVRETVEPAVSHVIGGAAAVLDHPAQAMAARGGSTLKRDPIVILRMDGEDLLEFINSPGFKEVAMSIFNPDHQTADDDDGSLITLRDYVSMALHRLTINHGMPPLSDSWVMSNIIEPVLQHCEMNRDQEERVEKRPISKEVTLLEAELKKVAEKIAQHLKEEPVIVAHIRNTFDGSGIKRLLSSKSELDMALDMAKKELPKDQNHKQWNKEYLRVALDVLGPITGLPPNRAVEEVDEVVNEVLIKMVNREDVRMGIVEEGEEVFKKLMREMLRRIMLELEAKPISISSNFIIQEPLSTCSNTPPLPLLI